MDLFLHIIRKSLLSGIVGICSLCSIAMASDTSGSGKTISDSVIVYSKADALSNKVTTLTRNDVFRIKAELLNGSQRWCAITNSNNVFIGYALCDQVEKFKKRPPKHKRIKHPIDKVKRNKSSKSTVSGKADNLLKSDLPKENAVTAPKIKENGPASIKNFSTAKGTVNTNTSTGISKKFIWLVFITVFILLILLAYLIDLYKRTMSVKNSYDTADQTGKSDLSQEASISGHDEVIGSEPTIEPVSAKEGRASHTVIKEADSSDINKPVEFQFWDCVIKKADESTINKLVKCQICGKVQFLASDFKCIECTSDLTYYIEVKQNHNI